MPRWTSPTGLGGWLTLLLGLLLAVIGLVLTIGGVQLAALGGSWYYLIAGLALIVSGFFLVFRDIKGVWIYGATFLLTLVWALWEKGLNGWALVPRLVGPLVLLFLVIATLPVVSARRRQTGGHRDHRPGCCFGRLRPSRGAGQSGPRRQPGAGRARSLW